MVQKNHRKVKILETYRDALQSIPGFIPTDKKVQAINTLLEVNFDILDVGSFVSEKFVPQFKDMDAVLNQIQKGNSITEIFVLTATPEGANKAAQHKIIDIIGYPFSTSPTFLNKNINRNFDEAWVDIVKIQDICQKYNKDLMLYLAMAFGNPYGDPVEIKDIFSWVQKFSSIGITYISLSDIIGVASPQFIADAYQTFTTNFPDIEFGLHLHTKPNDWEQKIEAAYTNGCTIFDGVISGLGGCPMTGYEMLGNLPTAKLVDFFLKKGIPLQPGKDKFEKALTMSNDYIQPGKQ
ncbi:MAG: hypothetical protein R2750_00895 [Bacteroidales bacterium]